MEAQFEVRYYSTHNMMAEFARKYSVGPRWPVVIVFWILYLFVLIPCIVSEELHDKLFFIDRFAKGTFEEFKQFLKEKRPDLVLAE